MINPLELRIGTLFHPGASGEINIPADGIVFRVGAVDKFGSVAVIEPEKDTTEFLSNFIHPIPITPQWLVKLGFNNDPNKSLCYTGPFTLCNYNEDNIYYFDYGCGKTELQFVHQLQNLYFSLTGKELVI